ncbi:hypothetical protein Tco_0101405 [Tanacetum coccineum]
MAEKEVSTASEVVTTANVEVSTASLTTATLAQTMDELKNARPKTKWVVMQEPTKVEADYQLAQRLQVQEQEELSDAEKATLFVQLLEKRRKHFVAKRAEEKRNRPLTKAQVNTFVDVDTELVKESSKKAEAEIA